MKSIKKIIWIVWDFWFFEKNKKIFEDLDVLVLQVKSEEDLRKCDWIFFWTSSFFQLKNCFSEEFFDLILKKIENNFPVFCSWQSINLFLEKIWNWNLLEKKWKISYNKNEDIKNEWEIYLDFLDSKEMKIKIFKNFYYWDKKLNFFKKIYLNLRKVFLKKKEKKASLLNKIWKNSFWENTIFIYKKSIFTIFSPEFFWDKRIYEYFINKKF